jgi:hypothetical protein
MLFQTIIYSVRLCARLAVSRLIILDVVYYPGTAVPHVCECDEHMVGKCFRHRLKTDDTDGPFSAEVDLKIEYAPRRF